MARRYRKSRRVIQREYRSRLEKYRAYAESTLDPKSFKEWNAPYRKKQFFKREYKIYKELFEKRQKSSTFGFRISKETKKPTEMYSYRDFVQVYDLKRNTLKVEVEMGERKNVGSVVNEMINDQAYELSSNKAAVVAKYLESNYRDKLIEMKLLTPTIVDGKEKDIVKSKKLELLIRQGEFVEKDIGLWDLIKDIYHDLVDNKKIKSTDAKQEISQLFFESPE